MHIEKICFRSWNIGHILESQYEALQHKFIEIDSFAFTKKIKQCEYKIFKILSMIFYFIEYYNKLLSILFLDVFYTLVNLYNLQQF